MGCKNRKENAAMGQRTLTTTPIQRLRLLASLPITAMSAATWTAIGAETTKESSLPFAFDSPPVLQNPAPDGMTVVWAINGRGTGWVDYGSSPDALSNRAFSSEHGLISMENRFLTARISGLKPGEKVFYRVMSAPIEFRDAYDIQRGEAISQPVFQFVTPDDRATACTFAIINDTHENLETLSKLTSALADDPSEYLLWNGDVFNDINSEDQIVANVLNPAGAAYAASRPVLFSSGNHDVRGSEARMLEESVRTLGGRRASESLFCATAWTGSNYWPRHW